MTIYATSFDPQTLEPTGHSADSGFDSLETVAAVMGPPVKQTDALLIYGDASSRVLFSRLPFYLGVRLDASHIIG